jgi:hypothetical protein
MVKNQNASLRTQAYRIKWMGGGDDAGAAYNEYESAAIEQIKSHVIPEGYKSLSSSTAMVDLMIKLAIDPKALATYKQNPKLFIDSTSGLTPLEASALKLGHQGGIIASMKGKPFPFVSSQQVIEVTDIALQKDTAEAWLIFSLRPTY